MSTVKLITPYNEALHEALKGLPVRIIIVKGPRVNYESLARAIFNPYKGKLVIFGAIKPGILPVDSHAYESAEDVAKSTIDNIVGRILYNNSMRTYSQDGEAFYDVYKVWYECRNLTPVRKSVKKLLLKMYNTTDVLTIAPWDGDKPIGMMTDSDDNYKRIFSADLSYPIIMWWGYRSVDGLHRLMKCALTGRKFIDVVVIPYDTLRKCRITENDMNNYYKQF